MAKNIFGRIEIVLGDITRQDVDAIVNAANESLLGGGGVDGAIHRAAGPELLEECRQIGGCPTGEARMTKGYGLPARHVIHTVGPIWVDGLRGEPDLLSQCYRRVFALLAKSGLHSVAFPSISTGAFGFPLGRAVRIALTEVVHQMRKYREVERVVFVCFDQATLDEYRKVYSDLEYASHV